MSDANRTLLMIAAPVGAIVGYFVLGWCDLVSLTDKAGLLLAVCALAITLYVIANIGE